MFLKAPLGPLSIISGRNTIPPSTGHPQEILSRFLIRESRRLVRRIVQEPRTTQKDLKAAGTTVKAKIGHALHRHSLSSHLLQKAALLKKRHVKACLTFATQRFKKPVTYWECSLASWDKKLNNTKSEVWRCFFRKFVAQPLFEIEKKQSVILS